MGEGQAPRTLVHVIQWVGVSVALPGGGPNDYQRRTLVDRHVLPWENERHGILVMRTPVILSCSKQGYFSLSVAQQKVRLKR